MIRNTVNKKFYIGITRNLKKFRWQNHIYNLINDKHNPEFCKDWKEIDREFWQFSILETDIPIEQQFLIEQSYLDIYHPFKGVGYNTSKKCGTWLLKKNKGIINNDKIVANICKDLNNKLTFKEIADKYNISLGLLSNIRQTFLPELVYNNPYNKITEQLEETIINRLKNGEWYYQIARSLYIKETDVSKIAKKHKLNNKAVNYTKIVLQLRNKGLTYRKIQKKLQAISLGTIYKICSFKTLEKETNLKIKY